MREMFGRLMWIRLPNVNIFISETDVAIDRKHVIMPPFFLILELFFWAINKTGVEKNKDLFLVQLLFLVQNLFFVQTLLSAQN